MSTKAARGTKRLCESCDNKFYDLNRDPIICPICGSVFQVEGALSKVDHIAESDDDADDIIDVPEGAEIVGLDEVEAEENSDIKVIEDEENLADIDDNDDIPDAADDDTFLEEDDEDNPDMSGIIGGQISSSDEES